MSGDQLNSQSDVYFFNVFVENGNGVFKLPYTSSFSEDILVSFRKLEYLPYSKDNAIDIKIFYKHSGFRKIFAHSGRESIFYDLCDHLNSTSAASTILNTISLYAFNYSDRESDNGLFNSEIFAFGSSSFNFEDNKRCVKLINHDLKSIGLEQRLEGDFDFMDSNTYPEWLSTPIKTSKGTYFVGILYGCFNVSINRRGTTPDVKFFIGNLDSEFKTITTSVMEVVVDKSFVGGKVVNGITIQGLGNSDTRTSVKHRKVNYLNCKGTLSHYMIEQQIIVSRRAYYVDAFGVFGNVCLFINRELMNLDVTAISIHECTLNAGDIVRGTPTLFRYVENFFHKDESVFAAIMCKTTFRVDPLLDRAFIKITSKQAFRSAVLVQNRFNLEGVLYQGKMSFTAVNPYSSSFVTCHRTPASNELAFKLQVFTNRNFVFGSETYENSSGVLIGELVIVKAKNRFIDNLF